MKADANDLPQTLDDQSADEMSEAEIDDNLKGTFPASDPPSWTLGTDHREAPTGKQGDAIDHSEAE